MNRSTIGAAHQKHTGYNWLCKSQGEEKNLGYNGTPLNFEWEEKNGLDYKGKVEWARGEKNILATIHFFKSGSLVIIFIIIFNSILLDFILLYCICRVV